MVDYSKFAQQMQPLSEPILNTLKVKEGVARKEVTSATRENLTWFLERHEVWFSLV